MNFHIPRAQLIQLYVEQRLTTPAVAAILGCSDFTVRKWLRAYDIEVRPKGRVAARACRKCGAEPHKRLLKGKTERYLTGVLCEQHFREWDRERRLAYPKRDHHKRA